jgi:hypothetical protein
MAPTLTLSRALIALCGLPLAEFKEPQLTPELTEKLDQALVAHGFDLMQLVYVQELPEFQGFHLTQ